jgi:hypothetical protein
MVRKVGKRRRRKPASRAPSVTGRLEEVAEALDIMVPELTARIAAVEHLLLDKDFCTRQDLVKSREFVEIRWSKGA